MNNEVIVMEVQLIGTPFILSIQAHPIGTLNCSNMAHHMGTP